MRSFFGSGHDDPAAPAQDATGAGDADFGENDVEAIAQVCHAANRAYCRTLDDDGERRDPWRFAPDSERASVIAGVKSALAHPDLTPEESHERWCRYKAGEGWTFGRTKDSIEKTHPCLRPWADLPKAQRRKDALFLATVRALAA